jgi:hypothetical protein
LKINDPRWKVLQLAMKYDKKIKPFTTKWKSVLPFVSCCCGSNIGYFCGFFWYFPMHVLKMEKLPDN